VRFAFVLRSSWVGVFATTASACYRGSAENSNGTAPSSAVPVVSTEAPAPNGAREESEATPSEPAPVPESISLEPPADVARPPRDAARSASGLASKVLKPGTGTVKPAPGQRLKADYAGWTKDGKLFDSSLQRNQPFIFELGQVIPGWSEGVQLMVVGERRRFWIPAKLAYGESPRRGEPAGDLTFDVELLEILPPPPETPPDMGQAPPEAITTPSGLAYKMLARGTGTTHPTAQSRVTVHYSGWTTGGMLFDSTVTRGQPSTFGLDQVIKGWTEGMQLMVVGDKVRFWIPADLAYGDAPTHIGAPAGMLVFDIELLEIK
jgi:peptidylprolyl isomerase